MTDGLRNKDLDERNSAETWMSSQLSIRNPDADMTTRGQRAKKDSTLEKYHRSSGDEGGFSG